MASAFRVKVIGAAAIGLAAAWSLPAKATVISFGLQEAGVSGGAITVEPPTISGTGSAALSLAKYGTFKNISISAQDETDLGLPSILNSQTLDISTSKVGTLTVYVTTQGLTDPTGKVEFDTLLSDNSLNGAIKSITQSAYLDTGNGQFAETTLLWTDTITKAGTYGPHPSFETVTGPFSVTEVYTIVAKGSGNVNLTTDVSVVPEPESVGMFALALLSLGGIWFAGGRRSR